MSKPITNQPRNQYGLNPLEAADEVHDTQTKVIKCVMLIKKTVIKAATGLDSKS